MTALLALLCGVPFGFILGFAACYRIEQRARTVVDDIDYSGGL